MEDASLDDFLATSEGDDESGKTSEGDDESGKASQGDETPPDEKMSEERQTHPTEIEPATVTYEYSSVGIECVACGTQTQRRWQSEGGPVCADCKEW